jgi:hypothetical protein
MTARRFRFRPRHRGIAAVTIGVGGALTTSGLVWIGLSASFPLIAGIAGVGLGAAYLASPTWRLAVVVDDRGLAVTQGAREKFALAWSEVVRVVASPTTKTCFIYGGDPGKSLLVPGDGAPAPYAIEHRAELYDLIIAHVDTAKIAEVATIEQAMRATAAGPRASGAGPRAP